ncbi:MAG: CRISPR-associated endonuclease Cas2 [Ideonella sp. MAG2]|nr:MAG: CRISPR-associated endonuclease Cas2 [Ideonella sp. MAG2]
MPHRLWLLAYDIAHPKRLRRVAKLAELAGHRQQKSVFHAALSPDERQRVEGQLRRQINPAEDHVLLHPICAHCRANTLWQGRPPGPEHEPFWIV